MFTFKFEFTPVYRQFLAVICCNILTFTVGLSSGWATINLPELANEKSTFSIGLPPLTNEEASFLVSFLYFGSLLGNYLIIPISQLLGTKRSIHLFGVFMIVSPMLILTAQNVYYLYLSRILIGMTYGALIVILPVLIGELCFDRIRGSLNALCEMMNSFGVICSFLLGNQLNCLDQVKLLLIPIIIFIGIMFILPDTPEYWISRNNKKEAIKANHFYKGANATLHVPNETNYHLLPQNINDLIKDEEKLKTKLKFSDFCTRHAKKSYLMLMCTQILCILCGTMLISVFVTNIVKETGSILSEKDSSIVIAVIQLIANLIFMLIVEQFNRRTLYIWSALLTAASYALFVVYGFLWSNQPGLEWMPPICLAAVLFFSSMGVMPIPYVISAELLPRKICKPSFSVFATLFWIEMFVSGSVFLSIVEMIGIYVCIIVFSIACILSALFALFCLPETRGKSFEEIEQIMSK